MDPCDFTKGTSLNQAVVTSTILTTAPEVYSSTPTCSKQKQHLKEVSKTIFWGNYVGTQIQEK